MSNFRAPLGHTFVNFDSAARAVDQIAQLQQQADEYSQTKADQKTKVREVSWQVAKIVADRNKAPVDALQLQLPPSGFGALPPLNPTEYALRQVFARLAPQVYGKGTTKTLPADYLFAVDPQLRAHILNHHCQVNGNGGEWLIRADADRARAVLSSDYTVIDNAEVIGLLQTVIAQQQPQLPQLTIARSSLTPDTFHAQIAFRNVDTPNSEGDHPRGNGGGGYAVGVYIGNDEIGSRKLRALPFVMRHSCTNSTIFDSGAGVEFMHRGSRQSKLSLFVAQIVEALQGTGELLDKMIAAQAQTIPSFADVVAGLSLRYGWTKDVTSNVLIGSEGSETRWGLVQGVSFAATRVADADAATDLSIASGRMLAAPQSLFAEAAKRQRVEVSKAAMSEASRF